MKAPASNTPEIIKERFIERALLSSFYCNEFPPSGNLTIYGENRYTILFDLENKNKTSKISINKIIGRGEGKMSKGTILIVDDEQAIRETLSMVLEDEGYNCLCASNGIEALKKIKQSKIDVMITDVHMPKMDGLQILTEIKNLSPHTKTIVITAYSETDNAIKSLQLGASVYLIKPLDFDDVITRVGELLGK